MVLTEISDYIDTKLSTFDRGISLDEYEKSLYLTAAQTKMFDELIKLFEVNGDLSKDLEPFIQENDNTSTLTRTGLFTNSIFFTWPTDLRKVIYEAAILDASSDPLLDEKEVKVIPTKLAEINRKINNPFRESNYEELLRVRTYDESSDAVAELLPPTGVSISSYKIKYIQKLTPIILEALPDGLEIEGLSTATNSKFNIEKLDKVIDLAIRLILQDKSIVKTEV